MPSYYEIPIVEESKAEEEARLEAELVNLEFDMTDRDWDKYNDMNSGLSLADCIELAKKIKDGLI